MNIMRIYLSIVFLVAFVFSSCKKDEVVQQQQPEGPDIPNQTTPEKVQWGFALYYTATW